MTFDKINAHYGRVLQTGIFSFPGKTYGIKFLSLI